MQRRGRNSNYAGVSRGNYTGRRPQRNEPRQTPQALGPLVRTLVRKDMEGDLRRVMIEITDCEYVASYNLMEGPSQTILVPGRPPLWTPSSDSMKLSADAGDYYRDENAARFQDHPLEPVVRSIFHMSPSFDTNTIDVVACGSTLGNLLRFAQGTGEPFSFVVHSIGQTAFFVRRNLSPTELIEGVYGYGHSFVEANTSWSQDVKGSSSHQRIISYRLGGMRMIVRFESDGYTMDQADDFDANEEDGGVAVTAVSVEHDLANMLRPQAPITTGIGGLLQRGAPIPQSSTIDIKTRSTWKQRGGVMTEQLPRLWLRQIGNIVLSFHNNGVFGPPVVEDVHSLILDWEENNQSAIGLLTKCVNAIKVAASKVEGGKLEVRCDNAAQLQLNELAPEEQSMWNAVPDNLYKRWTRK